VDDSLSVSAKGIEIAEITDLALVTLALPYGVDGDTLSQIVEAAFDITLPVLGSSSIARHGERFLGLHQDRLYILLDDDRARVAKLGYSTAECLFLERLADREALDPDEDDGNAEPILFLNDQSDSWFMVRLSGKRARQVLERVCPLDLHEEVFELDDCARTSMEHLAVIIVREADDGFLLLSPRSTARSFVHELELSVDYTSELYLDENT